MCATMHPFKNWLLLAVSGLCLALRAEPQPFDSHEVHADGAITFRLRAPGASKVAVAIANTKDPIAMAQSDGVWTATTPPLPPEIYWYSFIVDGESQSDPRNLVSYPNYAYQDSFVTVPGKPPAIWQERDVPHGVVHHHYFTTHVAQGLPGNHDDYCVYTPPGYDPRGTTRYPVLYLLHGFGQTASSWTLEGCAQVILDNLISEGRTRPMIVVMPLGYGDMSVLPSNWVAKIADNDRIFGHMLIEEVMPRVESGYLTLPGRENRAIAGLSMGGLQTLEIAFNHPELFAFVGPFSASASDYHETTAAASLTPSRAKFSLIWFGCGTREIDEDGDNLADNRKVESVLRARGFGVEDHPLPGMHTWMVWHECLRLFAPRLFGPG